MKSSRKQVFYDDLVFKVFEKVYEPAEDSFLAADTLTQNVKENETVLDIGTGCGILAIIAAKKARKVTATDINPEATKCAELNAENNRVKSKVAVRRGSLFDAIPKTAKFDVILFNAPYLPCPQSEQRTVLGRAWAGGPTGREVIDRFIAEVPHHLKKNGRILLVQSSLTDLDETLRRFQETGLKAQVVAEKKVAFERIVVIKATSQRAT